MPRCRPKSESSALPRRVSEDVDRAIRRSLRRLIAPQPAKTSAKVPTNSAASIRASARFAVRVWRVSLRRRRGREAAPRSVSAPAGRARRGSAAPSPGPAAEWCEVRKSSPPNGVKCASPLVRACVAKRLGSGEGRRASSRASRPQRGDGVKCASPLVRACVTKRVAFLALRREATKRAPNSGAKGREQRPFRARTRVGAQEPS
jgi:hypothetical protein